MKRFILIIIIAISISFTLATPILNIQNKNIQPKETLIATISTQGEFLDELKKDDIRIYEGRKRVYFEYELYFYNNTYYFYIIFNRQGEFTIKTKEILFTIAGEVGSRALQETITVKYDSIDNQTNNPTNLLSIKPGIIFSLSNSSQLKLFNRGQNNLNINIDQEEITIDSLQAQTINLNLVYPFSYLEISTYKEFKIPIIYLGANIINENTSNTPHTSNLLTYPEEIEITTEPNQTRTQEIELANLAGNKISNITLLKNISLTNISFPNSINPYESDFLTIEVHSNLTAFNEDTIILNYYEKDTNFNISIPIKILITQDQEILENNQTTNTSSCAQIGGEICEGICDGDSQFTSDGYCCFGECLALQQETQKKSELNFNWLAGLLLLLIVAIIGYFVYKKYHKTKPEKPDKKIEISKKRYENRLKGSVTRD